MRIPNTSAMLAALKSKDKAQIKAAADSLKIAADKYFASVPFPDVERTVAKKMLQTYIQYIPAERSVSPFAKVRGAAGVPPNVSKVTVMPLSMLVSTTLSSARRKTLKNSSENRARISWDLTGWYCSNIPSQTDCCRPPLLWQTPTRITMPHTKYG